MYQGYFVGGGVIVCDPQQSLDLFAHGYFGKGTLSRAEPSFYRPKPAKRKPRRAAPRQDGGFHRTIPETPAETPSPSTATPESELSQLSLEEAFYLLTELSSLVIFQPPPDALVASPSSSSSSSSSSPSSSSTPPLLSTPISTMILRLHASPAPKHPLSPLECWVRFCAVQPSFPEAYAAYRHWRALGWTPKCGLKYACDFMAYRRGPSVNHAEYGVLVQAQYPPSAAPPPRHRALSWVLVQNISRVIAKVAKRLVITDVLFPSPHLVTSTP